MPILTSEPGQSCERRGLLSVLIITLQIDIDVSTVQAPAAAPGSVPTALRVRNTSTDLQPGAFPSQFGSQQTTFILCKCEKVYFHLCISAGSLIVNSNETIPIYTSAIVNGHGIHFSFVTFYSNTSQIISVFLKVRISKSLINPLLCVLKILSGGPVVGQRVESSVACRLVEEDCDSLMWWMNRICPTIELYFIQEVIC